MPSKIGEVPGGIFARYTLPKYVYSTFITPLARSFDDVSVPTGIDDIEDATHFADLLILSSVVPCKVNKSTS